VLILFHLHCFSTAFLCNSWFFNNHVISCYRYNVVKCIIFIVDVLHLIIYNVIECIVFATNTKWIAFIWILCSISRGTHNIRVKGVWFAFICTTTFNKRYNGLNSIRCQYVIFSLLFSFNVYCNSIYVPMYKYEWFLIWEKYQENIIYLNVSNMCHTLRNLFHFKILKANCEGKKKIEFKV